MCAWHELEHSVGLEVIIRVIGVVIEGVTRLSRTGGIGGLSGCDIVFSGPTEREEWSQQKQKADTHSHCCGNKTSIFSNYFIIFNS